MDQLCVQQTNPCGMHAPCQRDDESRPPGPCRVVVVVCRASRIGYTAGHNRPVAKQPTLPVVSQTMKARTVIRWCVYIYTFMCAQLRCQTRTAASIVGRATNTKGCTHRPWHPLQFRVKWLQTFSTSKDEEKANALHQQSCNLSLLW
jgi:hypothetical protein